MKAHLAFALLVSCLTLAPRALAKLRLKRTEGATADDPTRWLR